MVRYQWSKLSDYCEGNEMEQPLNLKPKSLNQIFVIIQTDLFLWQETAATGGDANTKVALKVALCFINEMQNSQKR